MRRVSQLALAGLVGLAFWLASASPASAQMPTGETLLLNRYYYYPYYYFPHNYWPGQGPKWPEPVGAPYMKPPAYMAYPAFLEPHWRHPLWERKSYYRGFHFWLDQF